MNSSKMSEKFKIDTYSNKEKLSIESNGKIKIIEDLDEFENYIAFESPYNAVYLGRVSREFSDKVFKDTGIDIYGKNVSISKDEIKHIIKRHGNKLEKLRGQVPVGLSDLMKIPEILFEYDSVRSGDTDSLSLIFTKKIDNEYHLVETATSAGKRNRLSTKTMWINKRKDLYSAVNAEAFPETSKTHEAEGLTKTPYPALNRTENSPKLHVQNEPELGAKVNIS